ncbi:MAG: IS110 family transposase, partial [Anaerolineae bacterium]|nr:IS110 family transposase [Anaerolineae bacterium]
TTQAFSRCDTPQQAAAYAGLVPHHRQSGRSLHKRSTIGGGHPKLRQALYMAAGAAIQFNPTLKAFYNKKVGQGKVKQVARIAVARKLVHLAWACVVKHRDYDPTYPDLLLTA